ncbi:arachidonate 5-lipoxygenase, partial [Branchiostoma belcheri]
INMTTQWECEKAGQNWTNHAFALYKQKMGDGVFKEKFEELFQVPSLEGFAAKSKVENQITKMKLLAFFGSLRKSHAHGVGGVGTARIVSDPGFPDHEFFKPGRAFPVRIYHSNAIMADDASADRRGAFLKFSDEGWNIYVEDIPFISAIEGWWHTKRSSSSDIESPLDMELVTGSVDTCWDIPTLTGFMKAQRTNPALKDFCFEHPIIYYGLVDSLRRAPDSYTDLRYYGHHVFHFRAKDAKERFVKFRLVPADGHPESGLLDFDDQRIRFAKFRQVPADGHPESGLLDFDDQRIVWRTDTPSQDSWTLTIRGSSGELLTNLGLLPIFGRTPCSPLSFVKFRLVPADGHLESGLLDFDDQRIVWRRERLPDEFRPQTYLRTEFAERLKKKPINYTLQLQLHEWEENDPYEIFNPVRVWDPDTHPWIDLAHVQITTLLPQDITERMIFNLGTQPESLGLVEPKSIYDHSSVPYLKAKVNPFMSKLQPINPPNPEPPVQLDRHKYTLEIHTGRTKGQYVGGKIDSRSTLQTRSRPYSWTGTSTHWRYTPAGPRGGSGTDSTITVMLVGAWARTHPIKLDQFRHRLHHHGILVGAWARTHPIKLDQAFYSTITVILVGAWARTHPIKMDQSFCYIIPELTTLVPPVPSVHTHSGTDSTITVILVGAWARTHPIKLDQAFMNNFEAGNVDILDIEAVDVGEIQAMTLSTDSRGVKSDWYVDSIFVVDRQRGRRQEFPVYRWITDRSDPITLRSGNASLMSHDSPVLKGLRELELEKRRERYQWAHDEKGFPAHLAVKTLNDLPRDNRVTQSLKGRDLRNANKNGIPLRVKFNSAFRRWEKFDDCENLCKVALGEENVREFATDIWRTDFEFGRQILNELRVRYLKNYKFGRQILNEENVREFATDIWRTDFEFGRQILNEVHPSTITRCKMIPPNFPVQDETLRPQLERGMNLKQEATSGRLYLMDCSLLDGLSLRKPDHQDGENEFHPTAPMFCLILCSGRLYLMDCSLLDGLSLRKPDHQDDENEFHPTAPMALFYVNGKKEFVPIAIQLYPQVGRLMPSGRLMWDDKNQALSRAVLYPEPWSGKILDSPEPCPGQLYVLGYAKTIQNASVPSDANSILKIFANQMPGPENPIWTPMDSDFDWILAKMYLRSADAQIHQLVSNCLTQLVMEPFAVSTYRNLSAAHPVYKLLVPHVRKVFAHSLVLKEHVIGEGSILDDISPYDADGRKDLIRRYYANFKFKMLNFPAMLAEKGLDDKEALPGYYYRDDGLLLWEAISRYTGDILKLFYDDTVALRDDLEVQNWIRDVKQQGLQWEDESDKGLHFDQHFGFGVHYVASGRTELEGLWEDESDKGLPVGWEDESDKGLPDGVRTIRELADIVTSVIFTCSVHYAGHNAAQQDVYSLVPNAPMNMRRAPPKRKPRKGETEMEDIMDALPDRQASCKQLNMAIALSNLGIDEHCCSKSSKQIWSLSWTMDALPDRQASCKQLNMAIALSNLGIDEASCKQLNMAIALSNLGIDEEEDGGCLGHFSDRYFTEDRAQGILGEFQQSLQQIAETIRRRNEALDVPYTHLLPEKVPKAFRV